MLWLVLKSFAYLPSSWLEAIYREARGARELADDAPIDLSLHGDSRELALCRVLLAHAGYEYTATLDLAAGDTPHMWFDGARIDEPVSMVYYAAMRSNTTARSPEFAAHLLASFERLRAIGDDAQALTEFVVDRLGKRYMLDADSPSFLDVAVALRADQLTAPDVVSEYVAAVAKEFGI